MCQGVEGYYSSVDHGISEGCYGGDSVEVMVVVMIHLQNICRQRGGMTVGEECTILVVDEKVIIARR